MLGGVLEIVLVGLSKIKCDAAIHLGQPITVVTNGSVGHAGVGAITGSTYTKPVVGIAYPAAAAANTDWVSGDTMSALINCLPGDNAGT